MSPESKGSGQVAITARTVGPERAPQRTGHERPGGRRLKAINLQAPETRGIKNRKGESIFGVGAGIGKTPQRNGLEAGRFQAAQRDQGTSKGQQAKPHERRFARLSAHNAGGNWRAGDRGILAEVRPKNLGQIGR
jgi:hypothetical protein